jgi:hypothetical protein
MAHTSAISMTLDIISLETLLSGINKLSIFFNSQFCAYGIPHQPRVNSRGHPENVTIEIKLNIHFGATQDNK